MTETPAPAVTPDNARRLVAAALQHYADHWHDQLEQRPDDLEVGSVITEVAWARALADHVTGWTHTTRLREYLDASSTVETVAESIDALWALASEVA